MPIPYDERGYVDMDAVDRMPDPPGEAFDRVDAALAIPDGSVDTAGGLDIGLDDQVWDAALTSAVSNPQDPGAEREGFDFDLGVEPDPSYTGDVILGDAWDDPAHDGPSDLHADHIDVGNTDPGNPDWDGTGTEIGDH